jgi:hypothetical protein
MATAKVEEYGAIGPFGLQAPAGPPLRVQTITFTGTAGISLALRSDTALIAVSADADAYWRLTTNGAAAADNTDMHLFSGTSRAMAVVGSTETISKYVTVVAA